MADRNQQLHQKAIKGGIWTLIQKFGILGIQFVVSVILARILEPKEFGLIGMLTIFIQLSRVLVQSGMTSSLIRTKDLKPEDLSTVFYFNLVISLLLVLLLYFIAPLVAQFYKQNELIDLLRVLSLSLIIGAVSAVQSTLLSRALAFKKLAILNFISTIVSACIAILLALNGHGVWSLVFNQLIYAVIMAVLLWYTSSWRPDRVFSKLSFKKHFNYGYKLTISGVINVLFANIYVIFIGRVYSPAQLGYYNRAFSMRNLPIAAISGSLQKVTFPYFSSFDTNQELSSAYKSTIGLVMFLVTPFLFYLSLNADIILPLILTHKWDAAIPFFEILCIGGIFIPINSYSTNIFLVKGRTEINLRLNIIKNFVALVILFFTASYGLTAIIIGQAVHSFFAFILNVREVSKFISLSFIEHLKVVGTYILIGAIAYGLSSIFKSYATNLSDILILVVSFVIFLISFLMSLKIFELPIGNLIQKIWISLKKS